MIQLFHVYQSYGGDHHTLSDLSLEIEKGELVYLAGPSGAGKTTLLRVIMAAVQPSRGQVFVAGQNLSKLRRSAIPYLRRNIGVVFQDFKLLPYRSVGANVALTLEILNLRSNEIQRRTMAILKDLGLLHKQHQFPRWLSGGEQQRCAIARALVHDPQLLLADEPTGNLDPDTAHDVIELLKSANARGTTVVVATHDPVLLRDPTARVVHLERGRLA